MKIPRFGHVSGDFESELNPEFKVKNLNPETFDSGNFYRINDVSSNPDIFFANELLRPKWRIE